MKYLISTVETYRIDTEAEVEQMIADAKDDSRFVLTKYNCEHKDVKEKGDEVIFLRKITPGGADESYGIYVAKLAGIEKSVIKRAKEILKDLENVDLAKKTINKKKKKITTEEIQVDTVFVAFDAPNGFVAIVHF